MRPSPSPEYPGTGNFPSGSKDVDKKYWGIGVRIEDDILVKRNGFENLTEGLVKEASDIEEYMGGK